MSAFFGIHLGTRTTVDYFQMLQTSLMLWLSRIILDGVPFAYPTLYIRDVAWKYSLFRTRPQWWTIFSYDSHFDEFVPVTIVSYFSRCFNDVCVCIPFSWRKDKKEFYPAFLFWFIFLGGQMLSYAAVLLFFQEVIPKIPQIQKKWDTFCNFGKLNTVCLKLNIFWRKNIEQNSSKDTY